MPEELTITVTIDRSFGFTADLSVERGSSVLQLKEKLAALDPTGNTQASTFAVGPSPRTEGEAVQPLPDSTQLTEELLALDVCPLPPEPPPAPAAAPAPAASSGAAAAAAPLSAADAAREAARQAARQAQAARREREAAAAKAKAEEEARKKAEAEAARERFLAQAQAAGGGHTTYQPPAPAHSPWPAAQPPQQPPAPTLAGAATVEDDGETRVKGVSADGRYVFAYVGGLKHPHDVLALIDLFKGEASVEDLQRNKARFIYAGGTQDKATSVEVQKEVIIDAYGLEKGDYELASFPHDNLKRQLNSHLTKDNCVVMFGGKCLKIVAQHGI